MLKKAVSNKQFLYLVSAVLHPIITYRIQFSFGTMICKGLKSKSGLLLNFLNDAVYHSSLYGLKFFEQVQVEGNSLNGLDTLDMKAGAAVFFKDIDLSLGVGMSGLVSSTMVEL
ncbi:hypothetical protein G9A89_021533 [Geosiphon pyriformis]|nr:hypothetical protein G9A89_021533 [Geosiphon pyriformis]